MTPFSFRHGEKGVVAPRMRMMIVGVVLLVLTACGSVSSSGPSGGESQDSIPPCPTSYPSDQNDDVDVTVLPGDPGVPVCKSSGSPGPGLGRP